MNGGRCALGLIYLTACISIITGCSAGHLIGYVLWSDAPELADGETIRLAGLQQEVGITRRADGLWKIEAASEPDAMMVQGYLVARDRMWQLDLFRHMARGELAELIGNQRLGERTALQADVFNRFLGFRSAAESLLARASAQESTALASYARGINAWLEARHRSLEHRLLGVDEIRPWEPSDSVSIYLLLMHGLSGNWDREIRRLAIACAVGLDAMQRVFPTELEPPVQALPEEDRREERFPVPPAIMDELREELPILCAQGKTDSSDQAGSVLPEKTDLDDGPLAGLVDSLLSGWAASNNWVVAGKRTRSGKPILSNDPHLPHMNPPIVWGVDIETPQDRAAGFTIPGLHRVVFGHNGHVAWGATTNHVDRQDLVVHRGASTSGQGGRFTGYELEGDIVPFEYRTETFRVRGEDSVQATVRFTRDGPLLNDLEPFLAGRIPLTAIRLAPVGRGGDLDGARLVNQSRSLAEYVEAIERFDAGCSSWVVADVHGSIGYRSPCHLPIRAGWSGTFPVPGWLRKYDWQGFVPKRDLPRSTNPRRGWIATANSQVVPATRFPTTYNNDVSAPNRFVRIVDRLREAWREGGLTAEASAGIQLDVRQQVWPAIREQMSGSLCDLDAPLFAGDIESSRHELCAWDGVAAAHSKAASVFALWSNAVLDRALADELPGGRDGEIWSFVQTLPQFESVVQWLWHRPEAHSIWDDARTPAREKRSDVLLSAFSDAAQEARERWGASSARPWGEVRPFVLRHLFASEDGLLGRLLNSPVLHIGGDTETVFKQQYPRSDRRRMRPVIGPVVRFTVDMAEPWKATYTLAGGESGWPRSAFYGNLLEDWARGRSRPLTPPRSAGDVRVRVVPQS